MDKRIQSEENEISGIISGAEKKIIFNNPAEPVCEDYVVLYVHGFTACRQEVTPVAEQIAASLGANFYATRLKGHGLTAEELGKASPEDWMQDVEEAWQVASQLGRKVVILGTSTGAAIATWLAQQPLVQEQLDSLVLLSPNYRPKHWAISTLLWPWARYWVPLFQKAEYGAPPESAEASKYWTAPYPFKLLFGVTALAAAVRSSDVSSIKVPTLFIYSDYDETVDSEVTDQVRRRWGSEVNMRISVDPVENSSNHVVTGNLCRPDTNDRIISQVLSFIRYQKIE